MKTRLVRISYSSAENPDDFVILRIPDFVTSSQFSAVVKNAAAQVDDDGDMSDLDFADAIVENLRERCPGSHINYIESFNTIDIKALRGHS